MNKLIFVLLAVCLPAAAQATDQLQRQVQGQTIVSEHAPEVRLEFDKAFRYAGGQRFELYGVADAEQHFFVDVGPDGRFRRAYWVQFEGFLPSNQKTYNYKSPERVTIGGLEFIVDAGANGDDGQPDRPGSDGAWARKLLEGQGIRYPDEALLVRLVHLDTDRRNELMIIYAEDLAPFGVKAAEVNEGGAQHARWPELAKEIVTRAQRNMKIRR